MYKKDLALNNLQGLIYHKAPNKQRYIILLYMYKYVCISVCVCVCVCARAHINYLRFKLSCANINNLYNKLIMSIRRDE